jgi:hypothetical protein
VKQGAWLLRFDNGFKEGVKVKNSSTLLSNGQILNLSGRSNHGLFDKCCVLYVFSVFLILNGAQSECNAGGDY